MEPEKEIRFPKKYLYITGGLFLVLIVGLGIFLLATREPDQSLEDQEPSLEYAGTNSRLTNIQGLMDYGLTYEQYKKVYDTATAALDRADPDSKYFDFVATSLTFSKGEEAPTDLSDAEIAAILAAIGDDDATEEVFSNENEKTSSADRAEKEQLPVISFKLASDKDVEYTVRFNSSLPAESMTVEIYGPEGNRL